MNLRVKDIRNEVIYIICYFDDSKLALQFKEKLENTKEVIKETDAIQIIYLFRKISHYIIILY